MARNDISDLLRRPVVVAPMAGGPSTAELVIAAAGAGAVGFLAAGYKTAPAMAAESRKENVVETPAEVIVFAESEEELVPPQAVNAVAAARRI